MAIFSPLTGLATNVLSTITTQTWGPLVSLCKNGTLAQLQEIKIGKLVIFEGGSSKTTAAFGSDKEGVPVAFLDVHDEKFWVRLALFADMVRNSFTTRLCQRSKLIATSGLRRQLYAGRSVLSRSDKVL